jgi:LmbE family N-acetylglucosaminyl deacetylase
VSERVETGVLDTVALDSEGISAWIARDRALLAMSQVFHDMGAGLVIGANTIVDVDHSRTNIPRLHRALSRIKEEPVTEQSANAAELLKGAGLRGHKDATVAKVALRQPKPVAPLRSDSDGMTRLCGSQIRVISLTRRPTSRSRASERSHGTTQARAVADTAASHIARAPKRRRPEGRAVAPGTAGPAVTVASTEGPVPHGRGRRRHRVARPAWPRTRTPDPRYARRALGPRRSSAGGLFFMTDRPLTLMAVHAHPDDEATGTGGVLARYAAEGIRTVLVTCTDGGCGDGPGGVKPGDPGHDPAAVALMRRQELEASCDVLKISDLEMLDYADSGMIGWPSNDAPGSFWRTPVEEGAARLAELMRHYRPDVVVTYDENGFYGHPDHIQAHRITMAALEMTALTPKVYWTTMPRSMMQRFGETMREFGEDMPEPDPAEAAAMAEIGLPDDEITTWVDTTAFSGQKFDALAAHASQGENIFFLKMGKERFGELMGLETFVRVKDATNAAVPENDLFAGLR